MNLGAVIDLTIAAAAALGSAVTWFALPLLGVNARHTTGCAVALAVAAVLMVGAAVRDAAAHAA